MFKFYNNRKTRHPSISIKCNKKHIWRNMPISHSKPSNDSYLEIDDPHPKANKHSKVFVRKYVREDKPKIKGGLYKKYRMTTRSERIVKGYLKQKYKKR